MESGTRSVTENNWDFGLIGFISRLKVLLGCRRMVFGNDRTR